MNYCQLYRADIANGPGVRVSLLVSGCHHHCPGCFNKVTWNPDYGKPYTKGTEEQILKALEPSYIRGLSLLGGEPFFLTNRVPLLDLLIKVRKTYPGKDIWCFTGAEWEDLLPGGKEYDDVGDQMLKLIDVLVAGRFIIAEKDLSLAFRGSRNQYILDVKASLEQKKRVVLDYDRK